jgi:hypothetical protein
MATVGYGDITPTTSAELAACVFIACVGTSVFGYVIASVSAVSDCVARFMSPLGAILFAFCLPFSVASIAHHVRVMVRCNAVRL